MKDRLIQRVDQLLEQGNTVLSSRYSSKDGFIHYVDEGKIKGFRSACLSFIERVFGTGHSYYREFDSHVSGIFPEHAESGMAVMQSVRDELEGDWLFSIRGLVTAEVFSDFVEMADHLMDQGYKDAAAVIVGSTLEEHLRQLCTANGIEAEIKDEKGARPKKADRLNADLASADVYSKLDQKAITHWLDLRNKAAHGKYDEYNADQVRSLITSITEFMARVPA